MNGGTRKEGHRYRKRWAPSGGARQEGGPPKGSGRSGRWRRPQRGASKALAQRRCVEVHEQAALTAGASCSRISARDHLMGVPFVRSAPSSYFLIFRSFCSTLSSRPPRPCGVLRRGVLGLSRAALAPASAAGGTDVRDVRGRHCSRVDLIAAKTGIHSIAAGLPSRWRVSAFGFLMSWATRLSRSRWGWWASSRSSGDRRARSPRGRRRRRADAGLSITTSTTTSTTTCDHDADGDHDGDANEREPGRPRALARAGRRDDPALDGLADASRSPSRPSGFAHQPALHRASPEGRRSTRSPGRVPLALAGGYAAVAAIDEGARPRPLVEGAGGHEPGAARRADRRRHLVEGRPRLRRGAHPRQDGARPARRVQARRGSRQARSDGAPERRRRRLRRARASSSSRRSTTTTSLSTAAPEGVRLGCATPLEREAAAMERRKDRWAVMASIIG